VSAENLENSVKVVAEPWRDSTYYEDAEKYTSMFWNEGTIYRTLFNELDLACVIELACGHGRHAEVIASQCNKLCVIDVHDENISFCRQRLGDLPNIDFIVGNGMSFDGVADASVSAIYCYDAMVHFSPDLVESYLADSFRVLKPGGKVLLHHSNYDAPLDRHYGQNPHARNHMTFGLFSALAEKAGLQITESVAIDWGVANLDRVSLLRKPLYKLV